MWLSPLVVVEEYNRSPDHIAAVESNLYQSLLHWTNKILLEKEDHRENFNFF